jgi:hypothetical protein
VIDRQNEVLSGSEPERQMADGLDLIVHSLNRTVGGMVLGPTSVVKILDLFDALRCANSGEAVAAPHLGLRKKCFDIR